MRSAVRSAVRWPAAGASMPPSFMALIAVMRAAPLFAPLFAPLIAPLARVPAAVAVAAPGPSIALLSAAQSGPTAVPSGCMRIERRQEPATVSAGSCASRASRL